MLAAALKKNSTLTSIDLRNNDIGDEGAASLAAALEKNYALEELHISCSDSMREQIDQLLACNAARYRQWRNSVMGWMWASKHLHVRLPRDVALMIGKMIWKTRTIYESASIGYAGVQPWPMQKSTRARESSALSWGIKV